MSKRYINCVVGMLILVLSICGKGLGAVKFLSELNKKAVKIESYIADYKILRPNGKELKSKSWFKEDVGIREERIDSRTGNKVIRVTNKNVGWKYLPQKKIAYKIEFSKLGDNYKGKFSKFSPFHVFDLRKPTFFLGIQPDQIKFIKKETKDGEKIYTYVILGNQIGTSKKFYERIQISENGLLKKIRKFDNEMNLLYTIYRTKIIINPEISNKKFTFSPPKGIKVINRTKEFKNDVLE